MSAEHPAARGRHHSVVVGGYDIGDPDLRVTADVSELWDAYGPELRIDGMEGKTPEQIIRHVYEQNCDAPELEVENA